MDEINLRIILQRLKENTKIFLTLFTILSVALIIFVIMIPNTYRSIMVLSPNPKISSYEMSSSFGSSFSPLSLLDDDNTKVSKLDLGIQYMKSFKVFNQILLNDPSVLVNLIASKSWDSENNIILIDKSLYNEKDKSWVRNPPYGRKSVPSHQEAHEDYFLKNFNLNQAKSSNIITISYTHHSPYFARDLIRKLVHEVNLLLQVEEIRNSEFATNYLNQEYLKTTNSELKKAISELIMEEVKLSSIANSNPDYIFKIIEDANIPEIKYMPQRMLLIFLGEILISLLLVICVLLFSSYKLSKIK